MKEENKNNNINIDKQSGVNPKESPEKKDIKNIQDEIERDLRENSKYNSFFEKYHPNSKDLFIDSYKWKKADWLQYEDIYLNSEHETVFKYHTIAEECLFQIQQKKLFNLQCEWRAGNIELENLLFSGDFKIWERNIRNCPYIDPVTPEEADIYKEYLLSDNFERVYFESDIEWQNYERLKKMYHDEDDEDYLDFPIPEWYHFYDSRYGTASLLNLPDVKGERENIYIELYYNNKRQEIAKQKEKKIKEGTYKEPDFDGRPYAGAYGEILEDFVLNYENEKIQRLYRADLAMPDEIEDDEELYRALNTLMETKDKIDMRNGDDWRSSILNTAKHYECLKIYECFDQVYNEYIQRQNMGIAYEYIPDKYVDRMYEHSKSVILTGRKLNGEPEDFNF